MPRLHRPRPAPAPELPPELRLPPRTPDPSVHHQLSSSAPSAARAFLLAGFEEEMDGRLDFTIPPACDDGCMLPMDIDEEVAELERQTPHAPEATPQDRCPWACPEASPTLLECFAALNRKTQHSQKLTRPLENSPSLVPYPITAT